MIETFIILIRIIQKIFLIMKTHLTDYQKELIKKILESKKMIIDIEVNSNYEPILLFNHEIKNS